MPHAYAWLCGPDSLPSFWCHWVQHSSVALKKEGAFYVLTAVTVVDVVSIADVETVKARAIPPDGVLNEAREVFGIRWTEFSRVDPPRYSGYGPRTLGRNIQARRRVQR
jgi:hypothetical protein